MNSIFDEFYCGDIHPGESIHMHGVVYEQRKMQYQESYHTLSTTLNQTQQTQLEHLLDHYAELQDLYNKAYYREGFKTGIRLMCETFQIE